MYDAQFNPFSQNVAIVKGYYQKMPVLLLAILHLLSKVFSVISTVVTSAWGSGFLINVFDQLEKESSGISVDDLSDIINSSALSSFASMIPSLIVSILTIVGLLILFFKSRNANPASSPRTGAMILFIISLIQMIFTIILFVLILIIIAVLLAIVLSSLSGSSQSEAQMMVGGVIGGCIGAFIYLLLSLLYSISKMRYYKSVKNSLSSIVLYEIGAGSYGVYNIIFSVFSGFSLIVYLLLAVFGVGMLNTVFYGSISGLSGGDTTSAMLLGAGASLISCVTLVFEAIVALGYKRYIHQIRCGYQKPQMPVSYDNTPTQQNFYQPVQQPIQQPVQHPEIKRGFPQYNSEEIDLVMPDGYNSFSCPSCKNPVSSDAAFCPKCGQKLR